jgi:tRNA dimethylallyltransferase
MKKMITILGPTASGKTPVAAHLAAKIGGEIISADSRQVYRRMDIGTGKDLADYWVKGDNQHPTPITHHLIDICEPGTKYNLFQYQQDFLMPTRIFRVGEPFPFCVAELVFISRRCLKATSCRPCHRIKP